MDDGPGDVVGVLHGGGEGHGALADVVAAGPDAVRDDGAEGDGGEAAAAAGDAIRRDG